MGLDLGDVPDISFVTETWGPPCRQDSQSLDVSSPVTGKSKGPISVGSHTEVSHTPLLAFVE